VIGNSSEALGGTKLSDESRPNKKARLGEYLLAKGVLSEAQLEISLERQKLRGGFFGDAVVALGFVSAAVLGSCMEELTTFPFVELAAIPFNIPLEHQVPEEYARKNLVVAFGVTDGVVQVAMVHPQNLPIIDDLRGRLKMKISPYLGFKSDVLDAINRVYNVKQKREIALSDLDAEKITETVISVDELESMAEQAPIVRLVDGIIESAVESKASDIHIEPEEKHVRVRFRQDGILYEQMTFPRTHLAAVISRIKIMSDLDISERRKPQDGRISLRYKDGGECELRVSVIPAVNGESVVMRVLDKRMIGGTLEDLGMDPDLLEQFRGMIHRPHGLLLVTGPTGSGKTTTLYSSLMEITGPDKKIVTVEDPVEYQLPGITQIQVLPKIGLNFADCLRAIVRQDPDVILVGEIRDRETAEIAIQAALTGHLVLSTLHTNDAPGALIRLQNMGIEPFLLGSALLGVMAQRLLRTVCPHCKRRTPASSMTIARFGLRTDDGSTPMLASGDGCVRCNHKGMKGRTAVYEFMRMTDPLREMTLREAPSSQLRAQAITEGMVTMGVAATKKIVSGVTTLEETARVLFAEDEVKIAHEQKLRLVA
jgi:type IV pilus assembly protein PilB